MAGLGETNARRGDLSTMGYVNSRCDAGNESPYAVALDMTDAAYPDAKICAQVTENFSADEIESDTVGCGGTTGFGVDCALGQYNYRLSLTHDLGFQNGFDRILAQFMGTVTNNGEQTAGEGDHEHIFTFNPDVNEHFGTFAYETSDSDVIELPSTYTESINISMSAVRNYMRWTCLLYTSPSPRD